MAMLLFSLLVAAPAAWFLLLLLPSGLANRHAGRLGRLEEWLAGLAFLSAAGGAIALLSAGGQPISLPTGGLVMVYLDAFSSAMSLLIAFVGWVIVRYSRCYLAGDPRQGVFFQWLGASLASVFLLVIAGNLILLLAAWISTSLCLHHLLAFYPERSAAVLSARKKFVFSRMADACLLGAAVLLFREFGTLELPKMLGQAGGMLGAEVPWSVMGAVGLVAAGAIWKSAQFPFHTWLPDTLETPTPVSALMHAGIISAGGFLLIRLSPLVVLAPGVMNLLAIAGAVTAIFGSLVMLTQTSVKKSLAFSTVAQMGYMILQCGLGAFGLAALHLIAHSLYKAHAFLSSGSVVMQKSAPPLSDESLPPQRGGVLVLLLIGGAIILGMGTLFGLSLDKEPGVLVLGAVLVMAVSTLLIRSLGSGRGQVVRSMGLALAICATYFLLHHAMGWLLGGVVPDSLPSPGVPGYVLMGLIILAFGGVFLLQVHLGEIQSTAWGRKLYVLIFNRFYVNAFVNRLMTRLWPVANG